MNVSGGDILTSLGLDADQLRDLIDVFRPLGATFNDFNAVFAAQTSTNLDFNDLVLTIDRSLGESGELGFSSLGEPPQRNRTIITHFNIFFFFLASTS